MCQYACSYTKGFSNQLQQSTIEVIKSELMTSVSNQLQEICDNADVQYNKIYKKYIKMVEIEKYIRNSKKNIFSGLSLKSRIF